MKATNRFWIGCLLLAGITASTALVGCKSTDKGGTSDTSSTYTSTSSGSSSSSGSEVSNNTTQNVQFLFVQNAKGVSYKDGSMTLHGVNPVTVCFADRPERIAGHMPTAKIVPLWTEGKDSFTADPPNATLSVFSGDTVSNAVVVLRNPRFSGDELTYEVRGLEGTPPAEGGACSLFIDIIGMPMTPRSFAGAARRGYRCGALYGPTVVPVAPVVVARPMVVY